MGNEVDYGLENKIKIDPLVQRRKLEVKIFNDFCERSIDELSMTCSFFKI